MKIFSQFVIIISNLPVGLKTAIIKLNVLIFLS